LYGSIGAGADARDFMERDDYQELLTGECDFDEVSLVLLSITQRCLYGI
jgi:hypothetical protein